MVPGNEHERYDGYIFRLAKQWQIGCAQSRTAFLALFTLLFATPLTGCRSTSGNPRPETDRKIIRAAETAEVAYREGDVDSAVKNYRKALARAWALDDPLESGTNAYNLAACLVSRGKFTEAKDWLLDARIELDRADAWSGNTWLLEAKIARQEARFADADQYIVWAACDRPPCVQEDRDVLCGPSDPCNESCLASIPIVGKKVREKDATENCQNGYEAQIHFAKARVAAEQYDIPSATSHWQCGRQLITDVCDHDLTAESQNVAAYIHLAKGEHLQAGIHFDREAEYLRLATNYRVIPVALELAAAAYEQAGHTALAANRLNRVARINYGRGNVKKAWHYLRRALALVEMDPCPAVSRRLALVANQIQLSLDKDSEFTNGNMHSDDNRESKSTAGDSTDQHDAPIVPTQPINFETETKRTLDLTKALLSSRNDVRVSSGWLQPVQMINESDLR